MIKKRLFAPLWIALITVFLIGLLHYFGRPINEAEITLFRQFVMLFSHLSGLYYLFDAFFIMYLITIANRTVELEYGFAVSDLILVELTIGFSGIFLATHLIG